MVDLVDVVDVVDLVDVVVVVELYGWREEREGSFLYCGFGN